MLLYRIWLLINASSNTGEDDGSATNQPPLEYTSLGWHHSHLYAEDVARLSGTVRVEHSLARNGAEKLWRLLKEESYVPALGALTGNQAVEMAQAGFKAIYLSGWQVAADANLAGQMYPDQSLYPANSVPTVVRNFNNALMRADQISHSEGRDRIDWMLPIVADAEAGFGGTLNAFELMKSMIEAGAAGVHFEDQLSSAKKCGHIGGKVLVPTREAIQKLVAARLAADTLGVPTILIARTDAHSAELITSDCDPRDRHFLTGERTTEGFFRRPGDSMQPSLAASLMRRMRTSSGARPPNRTWTKRAVLPTQFTSSSRASCLPTTARHLSTGRRSLTKTRLLTSSENSPPWDTGSSS